MKILLETDARLHSVDKEGWVPLHWVVLAGNQMAAEMLFDKDASPLNSQANDGLTPLAVAVVVKNLSKAGKLFESKADLDCEDNNGWTPLAYAIRVFKDVEIAIEVVKKLLEAGANLELKHYFGQTPLSSAAEKACKEIARMLLNSGAILDSTDDSGQTPLMLAAGNGHEELVRMLIEAGADMECRDRYGLTALSSAKRKGHVVIANPLESHSRKVTDSGDNEDSIPPPYSAVLSRNMAMADRFLKKDINLPNSAPVNVFGVARDERVIVG